MHGIYPNTRIMASAELANKLTRSKLDCIFTYLMDPYLMAVACGPVSSQGIVTSSWLRYQRAASLNPAGKRLCRARRLRDRDSRKSKSVLRQFLKQVAMSLLRKQFDAVDFENTFKQNGGSIFLSKIVYGFLLHATIPQLRDSSRTSPKDRGLNVSQWLVY